jgi:hypothetical protein
MSRLLGGWTACFALLVTTPATAAAASAGDYSDPSGFSFHYPDGWILLNKQSLAEGLKSLPPEISEWVGKNKIDLGKMNVMLLRDGDAEYLENLNVVVHPQEMPMNKDSAEKLRTMLPGQYLSVGAEVSGMNFRVTKIGDRDAIVGEYDSKLPAVPVPLKQRQVYIAGGGNTYIVTCTSPRATYAKYSPTFDAITASFKVPPPKKTGFDFNQMIIAGIVGGVAAGVIALVNKFKQPKPAA